MEQTEHMVKAAPDAEETTFYEEVRKLELAALQKASGLAPNSEEFKAYVKAYYESGRQNELPHLEQFYNVVCKAAAKGGIKLTAVPFFEASWLLMGSGPGQAPAEITVPKLLLRFDELTGNVLDGPYDKLFGPLIEQNLAMTRKAFRSWVKIARGKQVVPRVRYPDYEKLIFMLAWLSRTPGLKGAHDLWTQLAADTVPGLGQNVLLLPDHLKDRNTPIRVAVTGDVGTVPQPRYMPFVSVNIRGFFLLAKLALEHTMGGFGISGTAVRAMRFPILHTQAMLFATIRNSEAEFGNYPAMALMRRLVVVENKRREVAHLM